MDPNATLKKLLDFARQILTSEDWPEEADFQRAAELIEGLDTWLRAGGFLPRRWQVEAPSHAKLRAAARIGLLILCRDGLQPLRGTAWTDDELLFIRDALLAAGENLENYGLPEGLSD